jgi:hypothetical protein
MRSLSSPSPNLTVPQIVHISPLIFSSIQLLDPVLTGIIVWMAGIEGVPDISTWIGGIVIMSGVGLITVGEYSRSHLKEEAETKEVLGLEMKIASDSSPLVDGCGDDDATVLLCESDSNNSLGDLESPQSPQPKQGPEHDANSANSSIAPPSYLALRSLWQGKESQQGAYAVLSSLEDEEERL